MQIFLREASTAIEDLESNIRQGSAPTPVCKTGKCSQALSRQEWELRVCHFSNSHRVALELMQTMSTISGSGDREHVSQRQGARCCKFREAKEECQVSLQQG